MSMKGSITGTTELYQRDRARLQLSDIRAAWQQAYIMTVSMVTMERNRFIPTMYAPKEIHITLDEHESLDYYRPTVIVGNLISIGTVYQISVYA